MANLGDYYAQQVLTEGFKNWFWSGQNGNTLIKHLNSDKGRPEIVRREKNSPYAYGIVLNVNVLGDQFNALKLVKIGFTQQGTGSDCENRMTQVCREIERHGPHLQRKTAVLFVIMKNPVDTSTHSEFETNFRKRWGMPVSNDLTQRYNLPFHTEWVLTTQGFIAHMLKVIQGASQGGRIDASIFKGITFDSERNLPGFLQYRRN